MRAASARAYVSSGPGRMALRRTSDPAHRQSKVAASGRNGRARGSTDFDTTPATDALVKGDVGTDKPLGDEPVLVRVHSHCLAGDLRRLHLRLPHCAAVPASHRRSRTRCARLPPQHQSGVRHRPRGRSAPHSIPSRHPSSRGRQAPAHPAPGWSRRPDPRRPRHSQDPPALQHPYPRAGAPGVRRRNRRASPIPGEPVTVGK